MRIGEVAARSGASPRSLRYYEQCGLIEAERSVGGQRHFTGDAVARVGLIRTLLHAGLGLEAVGEVLPCLADPSSQTGALTARLVEERDRLDDEIRARTAMRDALQQVIDAAPPLERGEADTSVPTTASRARPLRPRAIRPRRPRDAG